MDDKWIEALRPYNGGGIVPVWKLADGTIDAVKTIDRGKNYMRRKYYLKQFQETHNDVIVKITNLVAQGLGLKDVAKELDLTLGLIKKHLMKEYKSINLAKCKLVKLSLIHIQPKEQATGGKVYFTRKEIKISSLVAEGLGNTQISKELNISESMIKNYTRNIWTKTGSENRVMLAIWWKEHGHEAIVYSQQRDEIKAAKYSYKRNKIPVTPISHENIVNLN